MYDISQETASKFIFLGSKLSVTQKVELEQKNKQCVQIFERLGLLLVLERPSLAKVVITLLCAYYPAFVFCSYFAGANSRLI